MVVIWWYITALRPTRLWSLRQSCEIDWFRVAVSGRLEAQLAPFGHAISRYLGLRGRKFLSLLVVSLLFVRFLLSAHPAVSLLPSPCITIFTSFADPQHHPESPVHVCLVSLIACSPLSCRPLHLQLLVRIIVLQQHREPECLQSSSTASVHISMVCTLYRSIVHRPHCSAATVILFTVICLAMAAHFQSVLAASDLSMFIS